MLDSDTHPTQVVSATVSDRAPTDDLTARAPVRVRLGRRLRALGVIGVGASVLFGVLGWILVGRMTNAVAATFEPMSDVVSDIADTIDATRTLVSRTSQALTSIEDATRSTGSTVDSLNEILGQTADVARSEIAEGLDSAVTTLPGLIATARVVDRTMRTLSLLGVDYDPDQPLDESLADLEASLSPLPDRIRDQVQLLEDLRGDMALIGDDATELAAVLTDTRADMMDVENVLADAAAGAVETSDGLRTIAEDLDSYEATGRLIVVLATMALMTAAATPLIFATYFLGRDAGAQ